MIETLPGAPSALDVAIGLLIFSCGLAWGLYRGARIWGDGVSPGFGLPERLPGRDR